MKTKLTPIILKVITKRLRVGAYVNNVAISVGIHRATYYRWLERGKKAIRLEELGKKIPETEIIFIQFCDMVQQSEAIAQVALTAMIFEHAKTDWRAAMELLARKYPEEWARKRYVNFNGSADQRFNSGEEEQKKYDDPFKDIPKAALSRIISETTRKLYEAMGKNTEK